MKDFEYSWILRCSWHCYCRLLLIALALLAIGCPPPPAKPMPQPIALAVALSRYNANVAAIPKFSARLADWEIEQRDPNTDDTQGWHDSSGRLYFEPAPNPTDPPCFYLQADASLRPKAFVIAANATEFWLYSEALKIGVWGTHANAIEEETDALLGNPDALLDTIGLRPLPTNPLAPPYPVYRVVSEHNIIEYIVRTPNGFRLRREIVLDRRTDLPVEINDYNDVGLRVRHTALGNYEKLGAASLPGTIKIVSCADRSFLSLKLTKFRQDAKDHIKLFSRPKNKLGPTHYQRISPIE